MVPLLIAVFAVRGLWVIFPLLLPAWRSVRMYRRKERQAKKQQEQIDMELPGVEISQTLLHHVNHRISANLKSAYSGVQ